MAESAARKEPITGFHDFISRDPTAKYAAEPFRYHLYVSYACPWASRCLAYLKLKGLDKIISFTVVKPIWGRTTETDNHMGWLFPTNDTEEPGAQPDPIFKAKTLRKVYEHVCPEYAGVYSVPVLFDKKFMTIVNNDSGEIIRMFNSEFNAFAMNPFLDLYPPHLQAEIDETNDWVYKGINKGVYNCGFAKEQETYDKAVRLCFEHLDRCEKILARQRYMCGMTITEADVRLFVSLVRFDEAYAVHFNCNKRLLREYPNLFNYTKDIYQIPGINTTVNIGHIKRHYYRSHAYINPLGIIPIGPNVDFSAPHDRHKFENLFPIGPHVNFSTLHDKGKFEN